MIVIFLQNDEMFGGAVISDGNLSLTFHFPRIYFSISFCMHLPSRELGIRIRTLKALSFIS